jgi:hypothetical protein
MNTSLMHKQIPIPDFGHIHVNSTIENTEDYFLMAVRKNNKKRNFLFVSQLLGKHIPILPEVLFNACAKLTEKYAKDKSLKCDERNIWHCHEKTLIIGFAETATAMGHAVFDYFCGNCNYVHTTRNKVKDFDFAFEFEEEHCHAPEQLFFLQKETWIKDAKEIIIVDDEVTTGNTIKNIIEQIEQHYPGKSYSIITFLDWRSSDNLNLYSSFSIQNELDIRFYSFIQGNIETIEVKNNEFKEIQLKDSSAYQAKEQGWNFHYCGLQPNTKTSAENGISCAQKQKIHDHIRIIAHKLIPYLKGKKRAIVGTGEFMYIPLKCAEYLPNTNYFNATTRSPAIANNDTEYGIKTAIYFTCPTDPSRNEYLYNTNIMGCDEVVLFMENTVPQENLHNLLQELDSKGYIYKHVVFVKGEKLV